MPLRHPYVDPACHQARPTATGLGGRIMNAPKDLTLSRREFLKASGALIVGSSGVVMMDELWAQGTAAQGTPAAQAAAAGKPALVPVELDSWIAVLPNGDV